MVWATAQAVAADPDCCMAHIASCVAKGRLTFFVDNRRKVRFEALDSWRTAHPGCVVLSWRSKQCNAIRPGMVCMQVELAAGAAEDTHAALAADPENDLAHHLLGRWHTEMAQVCRFVSLLGSSVTEVG